MVTSFLLAINLHRCQLRGPFFFVNVFMRIQGYDCCGESGENLWHSNGFVFVLSSESSTHLPYTCK